MNEIVNEMKNEPVFSFNDIYELLVVDGGISYGTCSRITRKLETMLLQRKSYDMNLKTISEIAKIIFGIAIPNQNAIEFTKISSADAQNIVKSIREVLYRSDTYEN